MVQSSPDHLCYQRSHHPTPYHDNIPIALADILDGNHSSCVIPFEDDRSVLHSAIIFNQQPDSFAVIILGYSISCQERHLLVYFEVREPKSLIKTRQCALQSVFGELKFPHTQCKFICHLIGVKEVPIVIHVVLKTHHWDPLSIKKARLCEVSLGALWWWW